MTKKKWQINFNLFCKSIGGILISEAFNELLDEAVKRQQMEDERAKREAERGD